MTADGSATMCRGAFAIGLALMLSAGPATAQMSQGKKPTRADIERLVSIALVTDWVVRECGADDLDGMLLATMPSVLKQLTPEALAEGRRRVTARATRYTSKEAACRVMKGRLIAIQ